MCHHIAPFLAAFFFQSPDFFPSFPICSALAISWAIPAHSKCVVVEFESVKKRKSNWRKEVCGEGGGVGFHRPEEFAHVSKGAFLLHTWISRERFFLQAKRLSKRKRVGIN